MPYKNLRDVKIIEKTAIRSMPFPFSLFHHEEEPAESQMWIAVYHSGFGKWIATNDFEQAGMKEVAEKLQIVGYAESLDGIVFVIWEHQRSLGLEHTVLEDIKRNTSKRKEAATNSEWVGWGMAGAGASKSFMDEMNMLRNQLIFGIRPDDEG